MFTTVPEILTALWRGKRFTPKAYPSLAGIVKEVREASEPYDGSWLYVEYETTEGYSIMDFTEEFTVEGVAAGEG
jgi:hypothetical protein